MRIVHVIPSLGFCGTARQLLLLAGGLPAAEFDNHVCVLNRDRALEAEFANVGATVHNSPVHAGVDVAGLRRLVGVLKELQPDLVHTWDAHGNTYGRLAARLAGVEPMICSERRPGDVLDGWQRQLNRYLARRTARVLTVGRTVKSACRRGGIPAEKLLEVPTAVALADAGSAQARLAVREQLGLPGDAWLIVTGGSLAPYKRFEDLIWAADLLKVVQGQPHLVILGSGPAEDRLHRFRRQVRIEDRVHFLGPRQDYFELLAAADCCWLGSRREGQSRLLLEAMAHGLPVVATDIPGNRELITSEKTGLLVRVGDRAGFASASLKLSEDPARAKRLGAAGQHFVRQYFTVEQMAARYAQVYRELVA